LAYKGSTCHQAGHQAGSCLFIIKTASKPPLDRGYSQIKAFFLELCCFCLKMALLSSLLTFWGFFVSRAAAAEIVEIVSTPPDLRHCSRRKQPSYY
jgi:hypothetical protein